MSGGIPEKENAKDLLAVIKQQFEGSVMSKQYSCLCQLLSLKYDESESVRMHILKISKLVLQLRELGLSIDDTLMVHLAVFSLPKSFEMLQVHYQNQEKEWSLNDLIATCVAEEERHKKGKAESAHLTLQSGMRISPSMLPVRKVSRKEASRKMKTRKDTTREIRRSFQLTTIIQHQEVTIPATSARKKVT